MLEIKLGFGGVELDKKSANVRENKGSSIIDFPQNFTIIDIETTGLDPRYDEIIEVSAIKISNDQVVERFSSLIKSEYSIDSFITELTGITNDMVKKAPEGKEVLTKFLEFVNDDVVVGYNVHFDVNFLYDNILEVLDQHFSNTIVDVMRIAKKVIKDTKNYKLQTVAAYYNVSSETMHRGEADCLTCFKCFLNLKQDILNQNGTFEEFIKLSKYIRNKITSKDIKTEKLEFDTEHPFYNKECVFTGTLSQMIRKEAMQIVADLGGVNRDSVTKKTNYLILGDTDYSKVKDGKSSKHKKAEKYKLEGQEIEVISEMVFYDLL
ncbi:exonuclease domain-containing protein [Marinilactibacillus psychrotolerans]|uniref:Exonuclease domain-containing protein n=1 Tax=Marinilactibacillus psychrotolerans TaxID=191770 RepID=A0ABW8UM49_9LACT